MKALIFADAHIHNHKKSSERLQDCLDALEWVFKTATSQKVQCILFCGDLFHDRQKIDVLTYQRTFEIFEKYLGDNPPFAVYLLLGNHDLWHFTKWDVSSVNPLRTIPGVKIVDQPCTLDVNGFSVSFLPYTHDPISDIAKISNKSKFKILCGHIAVDGAFLNNVHQAEVTVEHDGEMTKCGVQMFDGWDQVFLGHYHAAQELREGVEYVGSPLQLSFGEAFQEKHVIIYDFNTHEKKYIQNDFSPKHLIIPEKDLKKYNLEGNFVRLEVDDLSVSNLIETRNELINEKKPATLEITQNIKKKNEKDIVEDAKAILLQEDEMIEEFVKSMEKAGNLAGLDVDKLLKIGKKICKGELSRS